MCRKAYRASETLTLRNMTPKFAQAIDPVMLHVLGLLERIAREEHPSPPDERLRIRALIDEGKSLTEARRQLGYHQLQSRRS